MKTSEAICSSVLPEATLTRGQRRSLGIKPLTFPLVDGATSCPTFSFPFFLNTSEDTFSIWTKIYKFIKKKDPTVLPAVFKCGVMAAELSGVEGRQMERAKKTNPHYTWLRCMSGSLSERRQSEKNISNVCVCVIRCVWNDEWRPRCGVSVCDSRCCVPVADGALGSPTAAGY